MQDQLKKRSPLRNIIESFTRRNFERFSFLSENAFLINRINPEYIYYKALNNKIKESGNNFSEQNDKKKLNEFICSLRKYSNLKNSNCYNNFFKNYISENPQERVISNDIEKKINKFLKSFSEKFISFYSQLSLVSEYMKFLEFEQLFGPRILDDFEKIRLEIYTDSESRHIYSLGKEKKTNEYINECIEILQYSDLYSKFSQKLIYFKSNFQNILNERSMENLHFFEKLNNLNNNKTKNILLFQIKIICNLIYKNDIPKIISNNDEMIDEIM